MGGTRNFPDRYVRHVNYDVRIDLDVSPAQDAQFRVVPGLANSSGYVSFESVNFPGYFLRHSNYDFVLAANDNSATFRADATFRVTG
ncbi:AbfB domain-containing protein [Micromonospora sp. NBRC 101691]|uniref:AbfB domain-containing protein n=1 Tax=Micromonospora sp. NBRC 101691 TaxID=3032198 RepID=UPI0025525EF3|nr:AbfB domain-containing protein [Micromonospora sp. NBRC 101691]